MNMAYFCETDQKENMGLSHSSYNVFKHSSITKYSLVLGGKQEEGETACLSWLPFSGRENEAWNGGLFGRDVQENRRPRPRFIRHFRRPFRPRCRPISTNSPIS